jgi:hypothetical protein
MPLKPVKGWLSGGVAEIAKFSAGNANHRGRIRYAVRVGKAKKTKLVADAWLVSYIRGTLFDALTPAQRMQFRMVNGKGPEAVARWASESLAKYPVLWHRLKNAERQRRFRDNARSPNWQNDWTRARKILGRRYVRELRKCAAHLGESNPGAVLDAALDALNRELGAAAQPPRAAEPHTPDPRQPVSQPPVTRRRVQPTER